MYSSVISRSVIIVIVLFVFSSCGHGGSKVGADKAKNVRSETSSTPAKSVKTSPTEQATAAAATRRSRIASAPTRTTTKNTAESNGITQFNVR